MSVNPIVYLRMNEGSGATAGDSSDAGNNFDGTIGGDAVWDNGEYISGGQSISFDGASDYVDLGSSSELQPSTAFSLSIWAKTDDITIPYQRAISMWTTGATPNGYTYIVSTANGDGKIVFCIYPLSYTGGGVCFTTDAAVMTSGTWKHIVATYSGDDLRMRLYIDGVEVAATLTSGTIPASISQRTSRLALGHNLGGAAAAHRSWDGNLDEFSLWDFELNDAQVTTMYGSGNPPDVSSGITDSEPWTFNGQLRGIVKVAEGRDADGNDSYAFLKKEVADNSTSLYFATDIADFDTYTKYASDVSGISGSPCDIAYGKNGEIAVGTMTGVYIISVGTASVPQSYTLAVNGAGDLVTGLKYGITGDEWAFGTASGGIGGLYSFAWPDIGADADLPSPRVNLETDAGVGARVIDIAEGSDGWMVISTVPGVATKLVYCSNDWSTVKLEANIAAFLKDADTWGINYDYNLDMWFAGKADGSAISTSDINTWLV